MSRRAASFAAGLAVAAAIGLVVYLAAPAHHWRDPVVSWVPGICRSWDNTTCKTVVERAPFERTWFGRWCGEFRYVGHTTAYSFVDTEAPEPPLCYRARTCTSDAQCSPYTEYVVWRGPRDEP